MKATDRRAQEMDAHTYWRGFTVTVHFNEPITVIGTVSALAEHTDRNRDGTMTRHPRLTLRDDDGQVLVIIARQTRLLAELVAKAPVVGDRVKIVYSGPAERAAPGMSPTKEFTVQVRKAGDETPPPAAAA